MIEPRHLPNAPITEALIDLRVKNSDAQSLERSLNTLKERLGERFPHVQAGRGVQTGFEFRMDEVIGSQVKDTGFTSYVLSSQDRLSVVQFRVDGFTYNRLHPYTSWEEIFPQALELWRLYVETARPEVVARAGLRYINHIRIPLPIEDFRRYLSAPPNLPDAPEGTLYHISGFLTSVAIADPRTELEAAVTQAIEPDMPANAVVVILDIDAFKVKDFKPLGEKLFTTVEELRVMKNNIFFGSITEETLRLFNGS